MKILRCIATCNPLQGGPWTGLVATAAEHAKDGHITEIATFDRPDDPWVAAAPYKVHALGPALLKNKFCWSYTAWLKQNASKFDGIILHGLWNYTSVGAWLALKKEHPYVVFMHGSLDPWFKKSSPVKGFLKSAYVRSLEGKVLADAKAVLFTAEEELTLAREAYETPPYRAQVVAYGPPEPPPASADQATAFREVVPGLDDNKYLLFLSRIQAKKGCDLLIEAFASEAAAKDLHLVMAGPDQTGWMSELCELAEKLGVDKRIHWPGMLSGAAKWGAFRGAEAFILPSHSENFGLAIVEALACEVPVLISDKVNVWREVKEANAGFVEEDTLEGTRQLLRSFLSIDTSSRAAMGTAAKALYSRKFGSRQAAKDLLRVLEEDVA